MTSRETRATVARPQAPTQASASARSLPRAVSSSTQRATPLPGEVLDFRAAHRSSGPARHRRVEPDRAGERAGEHRRADEVRARRQSPPVASRTDETVIVDPQDVIVVRPAPVVNPKAQGAPSSCPPCHRMLLALTLILAVFSIPIVYSASTALALENHGDPNHFLGKQIGFVAIGLTMMLWASRRSAESLRRFVWVLYFASLIGLLLTAFTPLGVELGSGTKRWFKLGPVSIQWSEFAKIALIGVLADFWSRASKDAQARFYPWAVTGLLSLPLIGLVYKQPHLSATLLLFALPLAIGFYAGAPFKQLGRIGLIVALLGVGVFATMKPYQRERIISHFAEKKDARGADYQKMQSQRALIHGGMFGTGVGQDVFKHLHLPAPHTDFVLATIGEQFGFVGMMSLTTIYGLLIFFCFHTGHSARSQFEALLCSGMGTLLAIQFIGNAGVVTGMLPVTGMPLPILTYGGSGLMCSLLGIGLVLGISRAHGVDETAREAEPSQVVSEERPASIDRAIFDTPVLSLSSARAGQLSPTPMK